jgi:preprotein translocase subunit SecD
MVIDLYMIEKILLKIFEPSQRVKMWAMLILVLFITLIAGVIDYARPYNSFASRVNEGGYLGGIQLPRSNEYPFRLGLDLQGGTHLIYQANLTEIPETDRLSAMEGVRDVIERRVNAFGVAEPDIRIAGSEKNRLNIELAGITDVNEAINLIGETPFLEFKELASTTLEPEPVFEIEGEGNVETEAVEVEPSEEELLALQILTRINDGEDFAELARQFSEDSVSAEMGGELGFFVRGSLVPEFEQAIFDDLAIGEVTSEPVLTQFGYHIIEKLGERTTEEGVDEVNSRHILIATEPFDSESFDWINTELSGKHVVYSAVTRDGSSSEVQVSLTFNDEGDKLFEEITGRNIGQPVGIFLDGQLLSSPTVQQQIIGGSAVITGNFTLEEAQLLSQRLRAGALPVPIELVSQQTIGASLGKLSVESSLTAGLWGLALVILFMIVYYRLPGLVASMALFAYGLIVLAIFKVWPVTLTLSGIAGFILSIGLAVDANVLIFSRLSEELASGKPLRSSIEDAFKRAWPSIRDGNVSTLITCLILVQFSTSLVKGFAITLAIGIIISMFSALVITKKLLQLVSQWKGFSSVSLYKVK